MTGHTYLLAIFLMAAVTYLPRVLPVLLLSNKKLPRPFSRWLSYIPVAVLAALLAPALIAPEGQPDFSLTDNPGLWVALPVFVIARMTRSLFATVLSGMAAVAIWRLIT